MPSIARRRNSAYALIGFVIFFLFVWYRNQDGDGLASWPPDVTDDARGQSRWKRLKIQYPVETLRQLPTGKPVALPRIQRDFPSETGAEREKRQERQRIVKDAFLRCWRSYRDRAWMHDELTPVTGGFRDPFGGWGATLVDSLDTLWIMGLKSEFEEAVAAAANISFDHTMLKQISTFETNIRYLGGFLAAFDLSGDQRLLDKAIEVGELLYVAFDTPNRMPVTRWNMNAAARGQKQVAGTNVLLAEIGSFSLEFTRLSILTGDPKWFDASERITEMLRAQQKTTTLPGLWPVLGNAQFMAFNQHPDHTLGAMADSWYEYLPKMHALVGGLLPSYREMYEEAMATAIRYNLFRPMLPHDDDILMSGLVWAKTQDGKFHHNLKPEGQHLACFIGGMLAMGGKLVQNQTHVDKAGKLTDGCVWAYKASPLGIMPETFFVVPCESTAKCKWDEAKWKKAAMEKAGMGDEEVKQENADALIAFNRLPKGFTAIPDTRYHLRPEAIESVFILYRITGRLDLLESAWDMFQAIDKHTRTDLANSALVDVTITEEKAPLSDVMESFWLGETLKYFYLIFSEPGLINLDEWVLNTEAHPLKRLLP